MSAAAVSLCLLWTMAVLISTSGRTRGVLMFDMPLLFDLWSRGEGSECHWEEGREVAHREDIEVTLRTNGTGSLSLGCR